MPPPHARRAPFPAIAITTQTTTQTIIPAPKNEKAAGSSPTTQKTKPTSPSVFLTLYIQNTKPRGVKLTLFPNLYLPPSHRLTRKIAFFAS
jgi:hypothetical protein